MTVIMDRDQKLLRTLGDYELMTTTQLSKLVFPGIDKSTALRRIRKLEHMKLIRRIHGLPTSELSWTLMQSGAVRIERESFLENINRNSLEHDITLTELRMRLEEAEAVSSWRTEQALRRLLPQQDRRFSGERCPDGIFAVRLETGFEPVALELELNGKNVSRYSKVFETYGEKSKYWAVWYVVSSESLGKRLAKEWVEVNPRVKRPKFGWLLLDQILASPNLAKLNWTDQTVQLDAAIRIKPISKTNSTEKTLKTPAQTPALRVGIGEKEKACNIMVTTPSEICVPLPHSPLISGVDPLATSFSAKYSHLNEEMIW